MKGEITGYIDVAQVTLYVFWAFFFALVFWLRKEDRREGYPLESDPTGKVKDRGFLLIPKPKTYRLRDGSTVTTPNFKRDERPVAARRVGNWPGAPLVPTGNPLVDGVGPAAWAERSDRPDKTWDGKDKIVPTRAALPSTAPTTSRLARSPTSGSIAPSISSAISRSTSESQVSARCWCR